MKRWLLALVLVLASAVIGHAVYRTYCPKVARAHCTMQWLRTQLDLSAEQSARIEAIHREHEVIIRQAHKNCLCIESLKTHGRLCACMQATQDLIDAVSRELNASQRARYLKLVAPCSHADKAKSPP